MSSTTPNLSLTLYDSTTDQVVTFATFRAVWGGPATTSNFYKIDTAWGLLDGRIDVLEAYRGSIPVASSFISANYYEATAAAITSYTSGMTIILSVDTTSNGTVTLNINALGTKSVMKVDSTGTAINLTGSDLVDGRQYLFTYDGTRWLWVSANSADQIQIVGTAGNVVTVGSDNSLVGTTTQSILISGTTHSATAKTTLADADEVGIIDSAASNVLKRITWSNFATAIGTKIGSVISALTGKTMPVGADGIVIADSAASNASKLVLLSDLYTALGMSARTPGGRLTLTTGVPVTSSDVTGATTIYYTPYIHNIIDLWDGSFWKPITFNEVSIALGTISSGLPYDVFGYINSGVLALEKLAWTNGTTRATGVTLQDGRYCKTGDKTRLYLGSFYTTSTTQTEDSKSKRFLWNRYNQVARQCSYTIGINTWTYDTQTWRSANADSNARFEIFTGLLLNEISISLITSCTVSSATVYGTASIGEDVTNAPHSEAHQQGGGLGADGWYPFCSTLETYPSSIGYHYYSWVEWASNATVIFYGGLSTIFRGGLHGRWSC